MAAKLVLEPICEADFLPCSYGVSTRAVCLWEETRRRLYFLHRPCRFPDAPEATYSRSLPGAQR